MCQKKYAFPCNVFNFVKVTFELCFILCFRDHKTGNHVYIYICVETIVYMITHHIKINSNMVNVFFHYMYAAKFMLISTM